jgi:V/A-type H+-transporting ATPase subunit C
MSKTLSEITMNLPEMGGTSEPLLSIALALGVIFAMVIVIVNVKLVLDIAPYAYPNAKIRSKQALLLGGKKLEELAELDTLMNIAGALENTPYTEAVPKDIGEKPDAQGIEASLNQHLLQSYFEVVEFIPGDAKKFFSIYMKKFEVAAIKTILRGVYSKIPKKEILKNLPPMYAERFSEVADSNSVSEVISKLEKTEYAPVLSQTLQDFEKTNTLLPLEIALDKYVYGCVRSALTSKPGPDADTVKKLLGAEIDVYNLKLIFRAVIADKKADISGYIIPYGYELSEFKLKELAGIEDIERIVGELEGTSFHHPLFMALSEYRENRSVRIFEKVLDEYYISLGKQIATRQPFGLGPILGYLVFKGAEVQNLITLLKLKMEGFSPEEIKKNMLRV